MDDMCVVLHGECQTKIKWEISNEIFNYLKIKSTFFMRKLREQMILIMVESCFVCWFDLFPKSIVNVLSSTRHMMLTRMSHKLYLKGLPPVLALTFYKQLFDFMIG